MGALVGVVILSLPGREPEPTAVFCGELDPLGWGMLGDEPNTLLMTNRSSRELKGGGGLKSYRSAGEIDLRALRGAHVAGSTSESQWPRVLV